MQTTIILPILNGEQFLEEALTSIFAQTVPVGLIAINDGSTDGTAAILQRYQDRLTIITNPNTKKIGASLNEGIRHCTTPCYLPFSYDDLLVPTYIEKVEAVFRDYDVEIVSTDMQVFGMSDYTWPVEGLSRRLKEVNTMFFSSTIKKSLWQRINGYTETMPVTGAEDWDFWIRAYEADAQAALLHTPLIKYRTHPNQVTHTVLEPNGHSLHVWFHENRGVTS